MVAKHNAQRATEGENKPVKVYVDNNHKRRKKRRKRKKDK